MHIIGCDFHTRFQQIAMMDSQTGEIIERRLDHEAGEAQKFYAALRVQPASGWKPQGEHSGLNGCWPSRDTNFG
jgi:hypothetical protein